MTCACIDGGYDLYLPSNMLIGLYKEQGGAFIIIRRRSITEYQLKIVSKEYPVCIQRISLCLDFLK